MASPTIDGHVQSLFNATNAPTVTLTTALSNDVIVVVMGSGLDTGAVTSISGGGLTWAKRSSKVLTAHLRMEVWWAFAASPLSAVTITVNLSGTPVHGCLEAFGVNGCYSSAAVWDTNGSLPASDTTSGSNPSVVISTSEASNLLLAFYINPDNTLAWAQGVPTGFTLLDGVATTFTMGVGYKSVSVRQVAVTETWTAADVNQIFVMDALTADAPPVGNTAVLLAHL